MITLVTGVPGSGKTYFAVHHISTLSKDEQKKILHNVEGLKLGKPIDDYCIENNCSPIDLFKDSFHTQHKEFRGYKFIIDECQSIFPKSLKDQDVQRFFQLHRHYGIDIILLSQDYKLVNQDIALLAEYQYRAVSDTANPIPKTFFYRQTIGYENIGKKYLPKKKKVFDLYKTADFDQSKTRKKSRPMLKLIVIAVIAIIFAAVFGYRWVSGKGKERTPEQQAMIEKAEENKKSVLQQSIQQQRQSNQTNTSGTTPYPASLQEKYGGVIMKMDVINDSTGRYVILLGTPIRTDHFPYPLVKTRFGIAAVVPEEIYNYQMEYDEKIILAGQTDPNASGYSGSSSEGSQQSSYSGTY